MSPEQAAASRELDGRSDLYALGCVLYEMLAGQPPFVGATAQQLLARHAIDPVPPLRTVRATVPEGVERSVMRALAKVPADRFPTAAEFAAGAGQRRARRASGRHRPRRPRPAAVAGWSRSRPRGSRSSLVLAGYLRWPQLEGRARPGPGRRRPLPRQRRGPGAGLPARRDDRPGGRQAHRRGRRARGRSGLGDDRVAEGRGLRGGRSPRARRARPGSPARRRPAPARGRRRHAAITWRSTHRCSRSKAGAPRAEAKVEGAADSLPQLVDRLIAQLITEGAGASARARRPGQHAAPRPATLPRGPGGVAARRICRRGRPASSRPSTWTRPSRWRAWPSRAPPGGPPRRERPGAASSAPGPAATG